jgi:D-threo-aldose 1-dehydrogenase
MLDHAFEQGIRHFDVARMYGYGEAEGILGEFLRGKRDKVTVVTKFGLSPAVRTAAGDLRARARRVLYTFPAVHGAIRRVKRAMAGPPQGRGYLQTCFDLDTARQSLETSLRLLGTDHVDHWLLHEATAADAGSEELLEFLGRARSAGKIGSFGIGTAAAVLLSDLDRYPSTCGVFQFDSHVLNRAAEQFSGRRNAHVITHGALLPLRYVREQLRHMNAAADGFREQTGLNVHSGDTVAAMLLSWALHQNPGGIVLFASNRREHISRNVAISADRRLSREITSRFAEFFPRTPAGTRDPRL